MQTEPCWPRTSSASWTRISSVAPRLLFPETTSLGSHSGGGTPPTHGREALFAFPAAITEPGWCGVLPCDCLAGWHRLGKRIPLRSRMRQTPGASFRPMGSGRGLFGILRRRRPRALWLTSRWRGSSRSTRKEIEHCKVRCSSSASVQHGPTDDVLATSTRRLIDVRSC